MKQLPTLLLIALSTLLVQCTALPPKRTTNPVTHRKTERQHQPATPATKIDPSTTQPNPTNQLATESRSVYTSTPQYPGTSKPTTCTSTAAPVVYDFRGLETEHVIHSYYNPFPAGTNEFQIDLSAATESFCFPLAVNRLSSGYGNRGRGFHSGIDLLDDANSPIYAAFDGTVRISKPYAGYGNIIVLRHDNGMETVYAHNTTNIIKVGDQVKAGDQIAKVGRTGRATANHLHFEIRIQGQTIDPRILVDTDNRTLKSGTLEIRKENGKISAIHQESGMESTTRPIQPKVENTLTITPTQPKQPTAAPTSSAKYHTVVKGDTQSGIAKKYGTSVTTICRLNNITTTTVLSLGRKLRVK